MHVAAYGGTPRKNEYAKFSNYILSREGVSSAELKFFHEGADRDEKRNQPFASRARTGENKNERRKTQILDCKRRARRA